MSEVEQSMTRVPLRYPLVAIRHFFNIAGREGVGPAVRYMERLAGWAHGGLMPYISPGRPVYPIGGFHPAAVRRAYMVGGAIWGAGALGGMWGMHRVYRGLRERFGPGFLGFPLAAGLTLGGAAFGMHRYLGFGWRGFARGVAALAGYGTRVWR